MRVGLIGVAAIGALALPAQGHCDGAAEAFLMGAPFARSDLSPLGPGVTTLRFEPGRGLSRGETESPPALVVDPPTPAAAAAPAGVSRRSWTGGRARIRDGRSFGPEPRWFLFGAARGRALGYSFLSGSRPDSGGWALERGGFFGDAQVGLAWRRDAVQVSLSYVQQEIDVRLFDVDNVEERRGSLTVSRFLGDPKSASGRRLFPKSVLPPPAP